MELQLRAFTVSLAFDGGSCHRVVSISSVAAGISVRRFIYRLVVMRQAMNRSRALSGAPPTFPTTKIAQLLRCGISVGSTSASGQNENPARTGLSQLPPAADIVLGGACDVPVLVLRFTALIHPDHVFAWVGIVTHDRQCGVIGHAPTSLGWPFPTRVVGTACARSETAMPPNAPCRCSRW